MGYRIAVIFLSLFLLYSMKMVAQESNARENLTYNYKLENGKILESVDGQVSWTNLPNAPPEVLVMASHPDKPQQFLVATKAEVFFTNMRINYWIVTFPCRNGFIPVDIQYSLKNRMEVWMSGEVNEANGNIHTELYRSINGGASWTLVKILPESAFTVHLIPDDARKYSIEITPQITKGK